MFASTQSILQEKGVIITAYFNDILCGALGAVKNTSNVLLVISLYLDEDFRRNGVAKALLREAENLAKNMGLTTLSASYICTPDEVLDFNNFFLNCGFMLPLGGKTMYSLSFDALENSQFAQIPDPSPHAANHIVPLKWLPDKAVADFKAETGHDIREQMITSEASGTPISHLCLAYMEQENIVAFIIVANADGKIYLRSAYMKNAQFVNQVISLLKTAHAKIKDKYNTYEQLIIVFHICQA